MPKVMPHFVPCSFNEMSDYKNCRSFFATAHAYVGFYTIKVWTASDQLTSLYKPKKSGERVVKEDLCG